ncbi:uncharacterized protein J4E84_007279 [Alternaria hordeiaustralica]|uniref:uncharacterized protein n=1 Tax=Alternaria hordeiaustralica TaxID=1187925 RepID=UPI0020C24332|nr:uncharacterized protein J4E84_007279 [Alternaria hordeiaustralica]KAI4682814.1 hypothetical protein J4E84_007279 [Alternaria hordeiaustralica]
MFNPIRKLLSFWSAADTSVTTSSNDASTKDIATESTAYRAACNHAAPPTRYASGVFNTTPSPPPNAALSAYLFSQVKDTNTSESRMRNIPPPPFPMFSAPTGYATDDAGTTSDDIDMPDATPMSPLTPPTTPCRDGDDIRPSVETPAQKDVHGATAKDDDTSEPRNDTTPPTSPEHDSRTPSSPPRQQDRQPTTPASEPAPNWLDEIVIEEDIPENALPFGYMGTFRGSRHFIPEYPGMKRCSNQVPHLLLCGHWIASTEPCGSNCKKQDHTHKQFKCPTCNDIVRDILTGSFQPADSMRLREFRKQKDVKFLACCVEAVVRAAPELKNGVTEAVAGFLCKDSGRECEKAENPDPSGRDSIEEIVRDMQERYERRQRERRATEEEGNMHEKRARDGDARDGNADAETQLNGDTPGEHKHGRNDASAGNDEAHDTSPPTNPNKKRKTSLETHREPITPSTRGLKRRSPFSPSPSPSTPTSSSTSSFDDPNPSPFAYLPNSKPPSPPYPSPPPKKRVFEKPDPAFGEASFVIAPPNVVGPLMRKRHADVYVEGAIERESKRRRSVENEVDEVEGERGREGMRGDGRGGGNRSGSGSGGITWKEFEAFRRAWDGREEDEEGECEL